MAHLVAQFFSILELTPGDFGLCCFFCGREGSIVVSLCSCSLGEINEGAGLRHLLDGDGEFLVQVFVVSFGVSPKRVECFRSSLSFVEGGAKRTSVRCGKW